MEISSIRFGSRDRSNKKPISTLIKGAGVELKRGFFVIETGEYESRGRRKTP